MLPDPVVLTAELAAELGALLAAEAALLAPDVAELAAEVAELAALVADDAADVAEAGADVALLAALVVALVWFEFDELLHALAASATVSSEAAATTAPLLVPISRKFPRRMGAPPSRADNLIHLPSPA
jgi:hypothetical protein